MPAKLSYPKMLHRLKADTDVIEHVITPNAEEEALKLADGWSRSQTGVGGVEDEEAEIPEPEAAVVALPKKEYPKALHRLKDDGSIEDLIVQNEEERDQKLQEGWALSVTGVDEPPGRTVADLRGAVDEDEVVSRLKKRRK